MAKKKSKQHPKQPNKTELENTATTAITTISEPPSTSQVDADTLATVTTCISFFYFYYYGNCGGHQKVPQTRKHNGRGRKPRKYMKTGTWRRLQKEEEIFIAGFGKENGGKV
jgi:hypothetical protein